MYYTKDYFEIYEVEYEEMMQVLEHMEVGYND